VNRSVPPPGSLAGGIARLAFFNATGFAAIGNTRQAFLSSLAPLVAFLLVGSGLEAFSAGWRLGLGEALQTLCILLGQPVASHFLAHWWKRDETWLRYATAMNWCQLVIPVIALAVTIVAVFAGGAGPSPRALAYGLLGAVFIYAVLLNWFLAWRGLGLTAARAVLFVTLVTLVLALLISLPVALRLALAQHAVPHLTT
jgi:hypothetical protein